MGEEVPFLRYMYIHAHTYTYIYIHTYLRGDARVLRIIAKDTNASAFGKLVVLVIEVLGDADTLHHGPWRACAQKGGREDDCVEGDIVLAHELYKVHIPWVLPPRLPPTTHCEIRKYCQTTSRVQPGSTTEY